MEKGVRQGNRLEPTLFALFFNDLIPEINALGSGINKHEDFSLSTSFYPDDIVLICHSEDQ